MTGSEPQPIADPTDSLLGWASQTEMLLSQKLADVDYFPDTDYSRDELQSIERFFGTFVRRQLSAGADFNELIKVMPALFVTTLIKRASRMVDPENFFVEYLGGLELEPTEDRLAAISSAVPDLLSRFELLSAETTDPVELLEVHTGVTTAKIPALLELLDSFPADIAPSDVVEQLGGIKTDRLAGIIAGIQAIREFSLEHPNSWLDRDKSQIEPKLMPLVAEAVIDELRERPVGTEDRLGAVGVATRELRPRIILDANRRKICLRLPEQRLPQGQLAEVQWRVSLEGTTRTFRTGRPWGDISPYSEALDITLDHQVRELTVADTTNGITWAVPVVDFEDPILIFNPKGGNITAKKSIHYAELLIVTPSDAELVDVVTSKPIPVIEEFEIEGWDSWICRRLNAAKADSIQLVRPGQQISPMRPVRSINPRQRVAFRDPGKPVEYVSTLGGLPVHTASLLAEFPPTLSGADETWYLSISAFAGVGAAGEEIAQTEPLEVPAAGGSFEIFDPEAYDDPWVGEYLVRLRGPRNESFRHEFAIVEGLTSSVDFAGLVRSFRIAAAGGLSESKLFVKPTTKPFDVEPQDITVAPDEAGISFVVSTEAGDQLPMRFTPPRLQFEVPLKTQPPLWRTTRMVCSGRDLDADGILRIRATGELGQPKISLRNQHGSPVRTVALTSEDSLTYTTDMTQLAAAGAAMMGGRLEFEWTDLRSDRRASVNLADISTAPHATGVTIDGDELVFTDLAKDRALSAWIWFATAPWVTARTLNVTGDRVKLPEEMQNAGPLIIQLFSADPFTILRAPYSPSTGAFTAEQEGAFSEQDAAFAHLSAFLAGEQEEPPTDPRIMPVLWDYLSSWTTDLEHIGSSQRTAVLAALNANPSAALDSLAASLVPSELQPGRVISSGLVHGSFGVHSGEDVALRRATWIGALELLGRLPGALETAEEEGKRAPVKELLKQVEELAGKRLVETLVTGRDATLDTACVDRGTVQLAKMDEAQQQALIGMLFNQAEIVPGTVMDDSARLLAVFETFKQREKLNILLADQTMIQAAVSLLRALRGANRGIYTNARIRFDKLDGVDTEDKENLWALAPVVSLVFALSARMHAHGQMGKSKLLMKASAGWSQLADVVPDLVTGDIVSAESMVLAAIHPEIAG